jgi:hypothetical protein
MFWRLPRSVHSATYGRSADPKHLEPILAGIRHAAGVLLAKGPVSAASRSAVDAFLATIPLHGGTVVSAQGLVPIDEPAPGSKATRTPASAILDIKRLVYESTGWSVVGVEAPASSYVTWLEKTSTMVQHLLRDAAADKALAEDLRNAKWVPKLRVRKGVAGYPQGTTALDVTSDFDSRDVWEFTKTSQAGDEGGTEHPKGAAAKGSITLRLVVVPDGQNRAWIGLSAHDATLRAQMRIVTSPGKTEETVGSLDGLEALRASSSPGGGFFHYGNALRMALRAARLAATERERAKIDTVVATLPHQLQTPMLLFVGGKAGTRPTLGMSFHVQAGTLEDVAALVRYAMSEEGRKHLESLDAGDAAAGAD